MNCSNGPKTVARAPGRFERQVRRFVAVIGLMTSHGIAWAQPPASEPREDAGAAAEGGAGAANGPCPAGVLEPGETAVQELREALCRPPADSERAHQPAARDDATPIDADDERPVPDYDNRPPPPAGVGHRLLWVPRVALFPLYLVSEYVVRRPLGFVVTNAERAQVGRLLLDFFTFGQDRQAGVFPTAFLDFGFRPSIGIYAYVNELGSEANELRLQVSWGGARWLTLRGLFRHYLAANQQVYVRGSYWRRPDWVFYGLGGAAPEQEEGRFSEREILGELGYEVEWWRSSLFDTRLTVRHADFDASVGCCNDPTVAQRIAQGAYPTPPGLGEGFFIFQQRLLMALDSRHARRPEELPDGSDFVPAPGSGVRWVVHGEHAATVRQTRLFRDQPREWLSWVKVGSELSGFVDLTGQQRVLGAGLWAEIAEPLRGEGIPFTQLVALGGDRPLRGFLARRLLDRSAIVARVFYTWPIWVFLDGSLVYEVGNVFERRWSNFTFGQLRNSIALGVRSSIPRDHAFQFLVALGTASFDEGSRISNVRLVVGTTSDF